MNADPDLGVQSKTFLKIKKFKLHKYAKGNCYAFNFSKCLAQLYDMDADSNQDPGTLKVPIQCES